MLLGMATVCSGFQAFKAKKARTDLLILTASHEHVLLVVIGMELGHEEHFAFPKCPDDLPCLRVPQFDDLVIPSTEEFAAVVAELYVLDALQNRMVKHRLQQEAIDTMSMCNNLT